jgi:hypothetical protein
VLPAIALEDNSGDEAALHQHLHRVADVFHMINPTDRQRPCLLHHVAPSTPRDTALTRPEQSLDRLEIRCQNHPSRLQMEAISSANF